MAWRILNNKLRLYSHEIKDYQINKATPLQMNLDDHASHLIYKEQQRVNTENDLKGKSYARATHDDLKIANYIIFDHRPSVIRKSFATSLIDNNFGLSSSCSLLYTSSFDYGALINGSLTKESPPSEPENHRLRI